MAASKKYGNMYKTKKYNFVYITTNLTNGKQYVGDHSTDDLEKDKYLGSGKLLVDKIKKLGPANFKREILEFFPSRQESFDAQSRYIKEYSTHISQGGYNLDWTGGIGVAGDSWGNHTEETKKRIGDSSRGKPLTEETKKRLSIANTGKVRSEESREKYRTAKIGSKLSEEHKLHIGQAGKNRVFSDEHRENLRKSKLGEKNPMYKKKQLKLQSNTN